MEQIECPICQNRIRLVQAHTGQIPWGADCACSDSGLCLFHRTSDERPPPRPDNATIWAKVKEEQERASLEYCAKLERRDRYNKMIRERARMRELLLAIVNDEATNYGYRDFAKRLLEDISR